MRAGKACRSAAVSSRCAVLQLLPQPACPALLLLRLALGGQLGGPGPICNEVKLGAKAWCHELQARRSLALLALQLWLPIACRCGETGSGRVHGSAGWCHACAVVLQHACCTGIARGLP